MKILLTAIHASRLLTPLALLYLKASLLNDRYLKEKVEVEIKEFNFVDTDDFILSEIEKYHPQIIGFSCYLWNIQKILALSSQIKRINRDITIILGGPQVSPLAKPLLKENSQIDVIVRGEGEITFLELIKSLLNSHKDISGTLGITYRDNRKLVDNADRKIISDLDSIPSPHIANLMNLEDREACLETQRGCIFRCHFCYYNKGFDRIRFFSLERVKEDLSFLLEQKLRTIYLMDPVFNLDLQRAKEICKFIIQNNKDNISFHTEIKAEFVDAELAELFHKANVRYLEIGLQSSEDKTLRSVNRKLNIKKFVNGIELLKKYDHLKAEVQLILGLPEDTARSFKKSLEFALNLQPKVLTIFRLQVLPGTRIWHKAKELGIVYEAEPPYYFLQSKAIPFKEVINLQKVINSLNLFRTKKTIKYLSKETKIKLLDIIKLWIVWLNDDKLLLSYQDRDVLKDKFRGFIRYFCEQNNSDFNFYEALLQKEVGFSIKPEKEPLKT